LILKRAGRIPVSELLDALDSNIQRYRAYPQPWCYKGELLLWLGRFDEAVACFEEGLSIERTRWAYIGIGAVHLLSGRPKDAMNSFAECERECGRLRGATLTVYRGECHRRYGEAKDAIKDLEEAVAAKPTRLGAWINLALSYLADGRHTEAEQAISQVRQAAPYLMRDAAKSCGLDPWRDGSREPSAFVPVFEEALRLMGGNRASSVTTYFDPEGRFRAVEPSGPWVSYARDHLFLVREAIQTG
jgi:tetratricopeptide (TPR) repeat protein